MQKELRKLLTVQTEDGECAFLMPGDYEQIIEHGEMSYGEKVFLSFLIATGVRYREFYRLSVTPELFMPERKTIRVEEVKTKRRNKMKFRNIKLSDWGLKIANRFYEINYTMPILKKHFKDPSHYDPESIVNGVKKRTIREHDMQYRWYYETQANYYLGKWAKKSGIDPAHFTVKSLRKTTVMWLVASHPNREGDIVMSIGHSVQTDLNNYRSTPFNAEDVLKARKYMGGWGFEDIPTPERPF